MAGEMMKFWYSEKQRAVLKIKRYSRLFVLIGNQYQEYTECGREQPAGLWDDYQLVGSAPCDDAHVTVSSQAPVI